MPFGIYRGSLTKLSLAPVFRRQAPQNDQTSGGAMIGSNGDDDHRTNRTSERPALVVFQLNTLDLGG